MNDVTILTSPSCHYCQSAKQLLRKHQIAYREVDLLQGGDEARQLLSESGRRTVPQIFIRQQPIGGYDELAEMLSDGEFDVARTTQL